MVANCCIIFLPPIGMKRPHYPNSRIRDTFAKINGCKKKNLFDLLQSRIKAILCSVDRNDESIDWWYYVCGNCGWLQASLDDATRFPNCNHKQPISTLGVVQMKNSLIMVNSQLVIYKILQFPGVDYNSNIDMIVFFSTFTTNHSTFFRNVV